MRVYNRFQGKPQLHAAMIKEVVVLIRRHYSRYPIADYTEGLYYCYYCSGLHCIRRRSDTNILLQFVFKIHATFHLVALSVFK